MDRVGLGYILQGLSVEDFLATYWDKQALPIAGEAGRFKEIFTASDWKRCLDEGNEPMRVQAGDGGYCFVSNEQAKVMLDAGLTLCTVVTKEVLPTLRSLNLELGGVGEPFAYCYRSRRDSNLRMHCDPHHVFILQIDGCKSWSVSRTPAVRWPVKVVRVGQKLQDRAPGEVALGEPDPETMFEVELTPGDSLYLPPGTWHRGRSTGSSLSISVCAGSKSVNELVGEAVMENMARHHPRWNGVVDAASTSTTAGLPESIRIALQGYLEELQSSVAALTPETLYRHWAASHERSAALLDGGEQEAGASPRGTPHDLSPTDSFRLRRGRPIRRMEGIHPVDSDRRVVFVYSGVRQAVMPASACEFLDAISARRKFTGEDALTWDPTLGWSEVGPALAKLIDLGLLVRDEKAAVHEAEAQEEETPL